MQDQPCGCTYRCPWRVGPPVSHVAVRTAVLGGWDRRSAMWVYVPLSLAGGTAGQPCGCTYRCPWRVGPPVSHVAVRTAVLGGWDRRSAMWLYVPLSLAGGTAGQPCGCTNRCPWRVGPPVSHVGVRTAVLGGWDRRSAMWLYVPLSLAGGTAASSSGAILTSGVGLLLANCSKTSFRSFLARTAKQRNRSTKCRKSSTVVWVMGRPASESRPPPLSSRRRGSRALNPSPTKSKVRWRGRKSARGVNLERESEARGADGGGAGAERAKGEGATGRDVFALTWLLTWLPAATGGGAGDGDDDDCWLNCSTIELTETRGLWFCGRTPGGSTGQRGERRRKRITSDKILMIITVD